LLRDDACHVDTPVVANAAALTFGSLKVGEAVLGDLALADRPVLVAVKVWEDVAVWVVVRSGVEGNGQGSGGEKGREGSGGEMHFIERLKLISEDRCG
jgi:hypothetical protein